MNSMNSQGLFTRMIPIAISIIVIFVFTLVMAPLTRGEEPFFSIALAKFSDEEAAKKEEAKLKNSGNNAFYKKEKNQENGNIEYQIYIEKYNSMEEAIKEAKVLKELELISNYLVKEVVDTPIIEEPLPDAPLEGSDNPQPEGDTKHVPESKTVVSENKAPVTESKKVEAPLPQAVKKEEGEKASEAASKVPVEKTGVPEQEKTSGQIRREPIPVRKETLKQEPVPAKPEEQPHTTDQNAKNDNIMKPETIELQKQAPEPKSLKEEKKETSTEPGTEEKKITKKAPAKIIREEIAPAAADQTPATTVPEPEKALEKKVPASVGINEQAKGATLQVGACKEEANAAILKKQLITLGRTAFYQHEKVEGMGDLFRIYITGYNTLGEAVKDAKTLIESGIITGYARVQSKNFAANMPPAKVDATVNDTGNSIYLIHTGSYKEEVNAQRAVALLKESGYKAIFVPEKEATVTWYRVYIGDFRSEAQARAKGMELLDKGIITYFKPVAITPQEKGN